MTTQEAIEMIRRDMLDLANVPFAPRAAALSLLENVINYQARQLAAIDKVLSEPHVDSHAGKCVEIRKILCDLTDLDKPLT